MRPALIWSGIGWFEVRHTPSVLYDYSKNSIYQGGGRNEARGEEAMLGWGGGGRELRLLCGFIPTMHCYRIETIVDS